MYITCDTAELILENAYISNPGLWREHSKTVAFAAKTIAKHIEGMDPEKACSFGLLHDIGRIKGFSHMRHVIDGYRYLSDLGYDENARICITHSFPIKNIDSYSGNNDCCPDDFKEISRLLSTYEYDDYDRLIQLCDALALPNKMCILEQRLIDVAIRNGVNKYSIEKWKAFLSLKDYFDQKVGGDLYTLLGIQTSS